MRRSPPVATEISCLPLTASLRNAIYNAPSQPRVRALAECERRALSLKTEDDHQSHKKSLRGSAQDDDAAWQGRHRAAGRFRQRLNHKKRLIQFVISAHRDALDRAIRDEDSSWIVTAQIV